MSFDDLPTEIILLILEYGNNHKFFNESQLTSKKIYKIIENNKLLMLRNIVISIPIIINIDEPEPENIITAILFFKQVKCLFDIKSNDKSNSTTIPHPILNRLKDLVQIYYDVNSVEISLILDEFRLSFIKSIDNIYLHLSENHKQQFERENVVSKRIVVEFEIKLTIADKKYHYLKKIICENKLIYNHFLPFYNNITMLYFIIVYHQLEKISWDSYISKIQC